MTEITMYDYILEEKDVLLNILQKRKTITRPFCTMLHEKTWMSLFCADQELLITRRWQPAGYGKSASDPGSGRIAFSIYNPAEDLFKKYAGSGNFPGWKQLLYRRRPGKSEDTSMHDRRFKRKSQKSDLPAFRCASAYGMRRGAEHRQNQGIYRYCFNFMAAWN